MPLGSRDVHVRARPVRVPTVVERWRSDAGWTHAAGGVPVSTRAMTTTSDRARRLQPFHCMNSKANLGGRPIHPMLVGFPIVLFAATIVLELAHIGTHDASYYRAAMVANIAGVVMALLAAIPGAIDLFSLPAGSPARATGIRHALLNVLTVALFAISGGLLVGGWTATTLDAHIPVALGMIGIVSMTYAMALGHALVQTDDEPTVLRATKPARTLPSRYGAPLHH